MNVVENWKSVLRHAWSVKFIIAAGILNGLELLVPNIKGLLHLPDGTVAVLTVAITAAAFVARFVAQRQV